jgi:hypothetical protein
VELKPPKKLIDRNFHAKDYDYTQSAALRKSTDATAHVLRSLRERDAQWLQRNIATDDTRPVPLKPMTEAKIKQDILELGNARARRASVSQLQEHGTLKEKLIQVQGAMEDRNLLMH